MTLLWSLKVQFSERVIKSGELGIRPNTYGVGVQLGSANGRVGAIYGSAATAGQGELRGRLQSRAHGILQPCGLL
jgi:hypothetical protein